MKYFGRILGVGSDRDSAEFVESAELGSQLFLLFLSQQDSRTLYPIIFVVQAVVMRLCI